MRWPDFAQSPAEQLSMGDSELAGISSRSTASPWRLAAGAAGCRDGGAPRAAPCYKGGMPPRDASYFRQRADDSRRVAALQPIGKVKEELESAARQYDEKAERLDQQQRTRPDNS